MNEGDNATMIALFHNPGNRTYEKKKELNSAIKKQKIKQLSASQNVGTRLVTSISSVWTSVSITSNIISHLDKYKKVKIEFINL